MGGNAFNKDGLTSVRMTSDEIPLIIERLMDKFPLLKSVRTYPIKSVLEKKDHGDIDIIVDKGECDYTPIKNQLKEGEYPLFVNGSVISILFEHKYQVDLIFTKSKYFDYTCQYYNHNDLGNLAGRVARSIGLKHGHDGFSYVYYYNDDKSRREDIYIGNDYSEFLSLLGLTPYDKDYQFKTYKDMFDYVLSSPYFNSKNFQFENLNNANRVRDKKRKTYNMFLEYIKDIPPLKQKPTLDLLELYPFLKDEIKKICERNEKKDRYRNALDIDYVRSKVGNDGKLIGKYMGMLKSTFTEDEIVNDFRKCFDQVYQG